MPKRIILIGGMPAAGKSTIAAQLSRHFDIPWISTDQIRSLMREFISREELPKLFTPEGYDAERFLNEFSAKEIATMELAEGEATWLGIKAFIEKDFTWKNGFIIEGVNLLPKLIYRDFADNGLVQAVFVNDVDRERVYDIAMNRGIWDDARTYPDYLKAKEVEWVMELSKMLKVEVEQFAYPWIEIQKDDQDLDKVLAALR